MSDNFNSNNNKENNSPFSINNSSIFKEPRTNPFQANEVPKPNLYSPTQNMNVNMNTNTDNEDLIMDIPVDVQIVLGSTTMPVATLMNLKRGSVISLDAMLGDPVDIVVNGKIIARGELVPAENDPSRFGVSLISILNKR